ncbi:response regulator [Mariluticola halotolerans]|uniref:response regulator n=1 Tax=Mariluticola halotolerans TaxID=2909283 RepID=UPI0026E12C2B|nr:response regulator [Mariluticola halotolerans]UJQ93991.1 response regulator [Mariluticola halotolerans]
MPETLQKLLYVEDDESIAEIVLMTLQDLGGFEVKHCSSGQQALDTIVAYAPQLVLMDVMMPGMDGPETLNRIRQLPDMQNLPVIFMTAKAQTHEQQTYLGLGAIGVIVKPFDPMTLTDHVNELWAKAGARDK